MRQFSLINETGEKYDLNGANGIYLFNPEGLGFEFEAETTSPADGFFKANAKKEVQGEINASLIFMPYSGDVYEVMHNIRWDGKPYTLYDETSFEEDTYIRISDVEPSIYYKRICDKQEIVKCSVKSTGSSIEYNLLAHLVDVSSTFAEDEGSVYLVEAINRELYEKYGIITSFTDTPIGIPGKLALIYTKNVSGTQPKGIYLLSHPLVTAVKSGETVTYVAAFVSSIVIPKIRESNTRVVDAYESYFRFSGFIDRSRSLKLAYTPNDTTYYTDVIVGKLDKTELAQESSLPTKITFNRLSMWYTVETFAIGRGIAGQSMPLFDNDIFAKKVEYEVDMYKVHCYGHVSFLIEDGDTGLVRYRSVLRFSEMGYHDFPHIYYSSKTGDRKIRITSEQVLEKRGTEFDGIQYADLSKTVYLSQRDAKKTNFRITSDLTQEEASDLAENVVIRVYKYYRSV